MQNGDGARLAVDIGGTFTDVVLENCAGRVTAKVLTTTSEPELGVMRGIRVVLERAGLAPPAIGLLVHGTTLATNAIVERKGARTALVTTDGFRDSLEMAYENRFDQYDVFIDRPEPLVPRYLRFTVPERIDAKGAVRTRLDEAALGAIVPALRHHAIESVAIGFLHSYANPAHEELARQRLRRAMPELAITLSSEVCPEAREYERFSTACANAYVQPRIATYLDALQRTLRDDGFACPLLLITSGGGLTTLETAIRFPIRLVESGPAGGAILASTIASEAGLDRVLSFDMGGTTAKICLIDDAEPQHARHFEVDRRYRFLKGSGLPVRVPVIEMVEIGAGGGSLASVDALRRITVGPESAGAEPGPACYGRGGTAPTVTDANLLLGRIDPTRFAGGSIALSAGRAGDALEEAIGAPLGLAPALAAFGVSEVVEENMANAARVHAVERGKDLTDRTLVAFGGGAPLHAARLAEKLGIRAVLVPRGAGVGSAIGFLRAPIAFEVARTYVVRLSAFAAEAANDLLAAMGEEAAGAVRLAAPDATVHEMRSADMRYAGQGHEITVRLPSGRFAPADAAALRAAFTDAYEAMFGRTIPDLDVEVVNWTVRASAGSVPPPREAPLPDTGDEAVPAGSRTLFDPVVAEFRVVPVYLRDALRPGMKIAGPAIIAEDETTTIVTAAFDAALTSSGAILLTAADRA